MHPNAPFVTDIHGVDSDGRLSLEHQNFRGGAAVLERCRLIVFEPTTIIAYDSLSRKFSNQRPLTLDEEDREQLDENESSHVFKYLNMRYVIMTSPYMVICGASDSEKPKTTIKVNDFDKKLSTDNRQFVELPKTGAAIIKGSMPKLETYCKYTAVVEITRNDRKRNDPSKQIDHVFNVIHIISCTIRPRLRVLDFENMMTKNGREVEYKSFMSHSITAPTKGHIKNLEWGSKTGVYIPETSSHYNSYITWFEQCPWVHDKRMSILWKYYPYLAMFVDNNLSPLSKTEIVTALSTNAGNLSWEWRILPWKLIQYDVPVFFRLFIHNGGKVVVEDDMEDCILSVLDESQNRKMLSFFKPIVISRLLPKNGEVSEVEIAAANMDTIYHGYVRKTFHSGSTVNVLDWNTYAVKYKRKDDKTTTKETLQSLITALKNMGLLVPITVDHITSNLLSSVGEDFKDSSAIVSEYLNCNLLNDLYCLRQNVSHCRVILGRLSEMRRSRLQSIRSLLDSDVNPTIFTTSTMKVLNLLSGYLEVDESGEQRLKLKDGEDNIIMDLNAQQTKALCCAVCYPVSCIIGFPGTGKTKVIEAIKMLRESCDGDVEVAVMTQGSCMADELLVRGISKAKTIHTTLKEAMETNDSEITGNVSRFQYKRVTTMIIDEFSNVSDNLAAEIYSPHVFPNLENMVHVYDPGQTESIESGRLASDYLDNFVSIDHHIRLLKTIIFKQYVSMKKNHKNDLETDENQWLKTQVYSGNMKVFGVWGLFIQWYLFIAGSLFLSDMEKTAFISVLEQVASPIGVIVKLTETYRFGEDSLILKNDRKILSGCLESNQNPLEYNQGDFQHFNLDTILPTGISVRTLNSYLTPNSEGAYEKFEFFFESSRLSRITEVENGLVYRLFKDLIYNVKYSSDENITTLNECQILALTNEHCRAINLLCDTWHYLTSIKQKEFHMVILARNAMLNFNALRIGAKLLSRTKVLSSVYKCLVIDNAEKLKTVFRKVWKDIRIPKSFNLFDCKHHICLSFDQTSFTVTDREIKGDNNQKQSLFKTILPNMCEEIMAKFADVFVNQLLEETECIRTIKGKDIFNGTSFIFRGIVDLKLSATSHSILLDAIQSMVTSLDIKFSQMKTGMKGKEAKKALKEVFLTFATQLATILHPLHLLQRVIEIEQQRWYMPYCGDKMYEWRQSSMKRYSSNITKVVNPFMFKSDDICGKVYNSSDMSLKIKYHPNRASNGCIYGPISKNAHLNYQRFIVTDEWDLIPIDPKKLPLSTFQPGWCITVNFSQGKEYKESILCVPRHDLVAENGKLVLKRSIYNSLRSFDSSHARVAITRPKKEFHFYGEKEDMETLCKRKPGTKSERKSVMGIYLACWNEILRNSYKDYCIVAKVAKH